MIGVLLVTRYDATCGIAPPFIGRSFQFIRGPSRGCSRTDLRGARRATQDLPPSGPSSKKDGSEPGDRDSPAIPVLEFAGSLHSGSPLRASDRDAESPRLPVGSQVSALPSEAPGKVTQLSEIRDSARSRGELTRVEIGGGPKHRPRGERATPRQRARRSPPSERFLHKDSVQRPISPSALHRMDCGCCIHNDCRNDPT
jgi:hypothetical protein